MGKARRHPELLVVLGAQARPRPLAEGDRPAADIHRHIEDLPHHKAHQLSLGMGRQLVMQAPQHAPARAGVVVLHKGGVAGGRVKGLLVPAFKEEAPPVAKHPWGEQQGPLKRHARRRGEPFSLHRGSPAIAVGSRRSHF